MFTRLNGFEQGLTKDFIYLENELERLLEVTGVRTRRSQSNNSGQPTLNVDATTEQVDIYVAIAGIDPKTVDISLDKYQMTISGKRQDESRDGFNTLKQERFRGEFKYLVNLPDDIDVQGVEANYSHGMLHICVKRREPAKPRQITVQ